MNITKSLSPTVIFRELCSSTNILDGTAISLKRSVTSLWFKLCFPQGNVVLCELHLKEWLSRAENSYNIAIYTYSLMANYKRRSLTLFTINTLVSIIYNRVGQSWNT